MVKKKSASGIPKVVVSPISLPRPLCSAKPGKVCLTLLGGKLEIVHVARLKAAVRQDASR
jgi:hypothetical protein